MRHCAKITCFDVNGDVLASPFFIVKRYVISYNKNYIMKCSGRGRERADV